MKEKLKKIVLAIMTGIMFLSIPVAYPRADTQDKEDYCNKYQKIVEGLKNNMNNVAKSGDVTIDYLQGSIYYNEAGLFMSKDIAKTSENKDVKKCAESIIKKQECNIKSCNELLQELKNDPKSEKDKEEKYLKANDAIIDETVKKLDSKKSETNKDILYLNAMLIYFEADVKLENNALTYIESKELKEETKKEIEEENKQIEDLKKILSSIK